MKPLYTIDCPGLELVNTSNGSRQRHWSWKKRLVDRVRESVCARAAHLQKAVPLAKAKVGITVWHKGTYDWDGLYCAIKPVLDAIVARKVRVHGIQTRRWGLIEDDSPKHCDLAPVQEPGDWRVLIEVWPA